MCRYLRKMNLYSPLYNRFIADTHDVVIVVLTEQVNHDFSIFFDMLQDYKPYLIFDKLPIIHLQKYVNDMFLETTNFLAHLL